MLVPLLLALGLLTAPAAGAADPAGVTADRTGAGPTKSLRLVVPRGYAGQTVRVTARLRAADGDPDADQEVRLQRHDGRRWQLLDAATTAADGTVSAPAVLGRRTERNRFRAVHTTPSRTLTTTRAVALRQRSSTLALAGQAQVRDGRAITLRVRWVSGNGEPVRGRVSLQRAVGRSWRTVATLRPDADGRATHRTTPFGRERWRAVGRGQAWVRGDTSDALAVRSIPPGDPVRLPAGAPAPRVALPGQPRAVGEGPNATATRIPDGVWADMVGKSWRAGCPVGRDGLRLVRTNYWDFDGYRRRGELVVNAAIVGKTLDVMRAIYDARLPIRHLYRVDRFGYSSSLNGADDHASMAADNTSAFNCRVVVGRPGRRSPHAQGRSIDINPWENPYRASFGWTPNTWWVQKSHPRVAWRSASHRMVRIFTSRGFRWTYGTFDAHHFDGRRAVGTDRAPRPLACDGGVCH